MAEKTVVYRCLRQDIDVPGGFAYLGKFVAAPGMDSAEQIATAKRMFPGCASPVVEQGR